MNSHSKIDIGHLAMLARLNLSPEECAKFQEQIEDTLSYVDKMAKLNVDGVEPMATALPVVNIFREDLPHEGLAREKAMSNAPDQEGPFFKVPRIIQGGEEGDGDAS